MVAGTCRQLAKVHRAQLAAEGLLGDTDLELVPQPLAQIDDAPADYAVDGGDGPVVDRCRQGRPVRVVEQRRLARRLTVHQPWRPARIEPQHPIPNDLPCDTADLGGRRACGSLVDRRQRQQSSDLIGVLALARTQADASRVIVGPERDRHRQTPKAASPVLNQNVTASGSPNESGSLGLGINRVLGVEWCVAGPSALIGASNFFELAVATAIVLFGFQSGAALATVVGVLVEVPVMLSVVHIVRRSRAWYEHA